MPPERCLVLRLEWVLLVPLRKVAIGFKTVTVYYTSISVALCPCMIRGNSTTSSNTILVIQLYRSVGGTPKPTDHSIYNSTSEKPS